MADTAETAPDPKTIPPAVFKNGREVKNKKIPASQSRHATAIIEFLLVYSSKMTF